MKCLLSNLASTVEITLTPFLKVASCHLNEYGEKVNGMLNAALEHSLVSYNKSHTEHVIKCNIEIK